MSRGALRQGVDAIRARMAILGISQERFALAMGYERSAISRYLSGTRPMPEGFKERVTAALDLLEVAERAAAEARERVLAEGE